MKTIITLILLINAAVTYTQSNTCACCGEEYKKFDFWSGNWQVSSNDQFAGTNNIYYIQDSCILLENWVGAAGTTGTSMNYFNKVDSTWNQLWIDNQGNKLQLNGQFNGESMVLISEPTVNKQNQIIINKITWTPLEDGTVRQLWEATRDGGKQWQIIFDGIYSKS